MVEASPSVPILGRPTAVSNSQTVPCITDRLKSGLAPATKRASVNLLVLTKWVLGFQEIALVTDPIAPFAPESHGFTP